MARQMSRRSQELNGAPESHPYPHFPVFMQYLALMQTQTAPQHRPTVFIKTYGCQMNLADSELVAALLEKDGFTRVDQPEDASVILVNTCIVREHAQEKAITNISRFQKYKEADPRVRIGVLGCMASHTGRMVADRLPFLDWVLGPDTYRSLPELVRISKATSGPVLITNGPDDELYEAQAASRREGVNAWVVITRGCNNFCTYCVVPYARGRERYRKADAILDEIRDTVDQGYPQVTLLGQNVNSWRDHDARFADLLERAAQVEGLKRLRFITSHPKDLSPRLLDVLGSGGPICPELHLPLQAGGDRILKRMGRGYTSGHYRGLVGEARKKIPDLLLSTDIIVGFPGETEEEYQQTRDLVEQVGYDDAFVYRYSERPGTAAANLEDDVPEKVKIERLTEIGELVRASGRKRREALIGRTLDVLVESPSTKDPAEVMGRTAAGHIVVFPGRAEIGALTRVNIQEVRGFTLRGVAIQD